MVGTLLEAEAGVARPREELPPSGQEPLVRPELFVRPDALVGSRHEGLRCVQCHQDAAALPHASQLAPAGCATSCHAEEGRLYGEGSHAEAVVRGDARAPTCGFCHGGHEVLKPSDRRASSSKLKSLHLCGDCHASHAPTRDDPDPAGRVSDYLGSTHARALIKAGLSMAATCADCHGAHRVRPSADASSSVNRSQIPKTCGRCHVGVEEEYAKSVHGVKHAEGNEAAAVCTDCHTAHQITHAGTPEFMADVINDCGRCHDSKDATGQRVGTYYQTYSASYHGQVTKLGAKRAARCSDCHGAHNIRSLDDPASQVAGPNLLETCAKCHPRANANFVKFDPHANYRDANNYPVLHGVWLYFMIMMSSVFTFFGVHTILWFIRARRERARMSAHHGHTATAIRRFTKLDRINHALVAITFFGLTTTGIPLVFADQAWARTLAALLGGIEAAGMWHRFFAVLLIVNFAVHFAGLGLRFMRRSGKALDWVFGPNSLVFRWKDIKDVLGMFGWFFGRRRPPRLDRWTYWEKFDYWAEVGGSMIIGGSGLLLWFPEIAAKVLPGWVFNVAMIVHGYEALLAIGFIFTIHFFNAHLRPGTFPVDAVIFTGSMPEQELREQRPEEYERLVRTGRLESLRVAAPDPARRPAIVVIAIVSVGFGLLLLALILVGGLS
ncbi:MAG: hypothetical protein ACOYN0_04570 [Phycisphaerales bacterium]